MKKIFSMALAGAMIAGLAATAMATSLKDYTVELGNVSTYSSDDKTMTLANGPKAFAEYGEAAYFAIQYKEGNNAAKYLSNYSDVEKLKVKAKWEMGSDLVESISIVKKNVTADNTTYGSNYAYFLEIKIADSTSVNDADIIGTVTFNNSEAYVNGADKGKIKDSESDINFKVFHGNNYITTTIYEVTSDVADLEWGNTYALKFDYDDEVEFSFGSDNGGNNEGTFTVDVSGQGKLLLSYNTKVDEAIGAANTGANLRALNFNNVTFNRTGEFVYEWENGGYIYQVIDGQLYTMPNATFDGDEYTFTTRTLGSYIFSDIELVNPEIVVETPEVEAPEVNNPTTGAAV